MNHLNPYIAINPFQMQRAGDRSAHPLQLMCEVLKIYLGPQILKSALVVSSWHFVYDSVFEPSLVLFPQRYGSQVIRETVRDWNIRQRTLRTQRNHIDFMDGRFSICGHYKLQPVFFGRIQSTCNLKICVNCLF